MMTFSLGVVLLSALVALALTGTVGPHDPATVTLGMVAAWCLFGPIRARMYRKH